MATNDKMRIYARHSHGFFDELVTMLVSYGAVGLGVAPYVPGAPFSEPASWNWGCYVTGKEHVANVAFHFDPAAIIRLIATGEWPAELEIIERAVTTSPSEGQVQAAQFEGKKIVRGIFEGGYLHYFERAKRLVRQPEPEVWRFGRVIRNAIAHGGTIDIRNPKSQPVTWRSLRYAQADSGKQIWYVDVTPVELILLMEDLDKAL